MAVWIWPCPVLFIQVGCSSAELSSLEPSSHLSQLSVSFLAFHSVQAWHKLLSCLQVQLLSWRSYHVFFLPVIWAREIVWCLQSHQWNTLHFGRFTAQGLSDTRSTSCFRDFFLASPLRSFSSYQSLHDFFVECGSRERRFTVKQK